MCCNGWRSEVISIRLTHAPQIEQYQTYIESWYLFGLVLVFRRQRVIFH